MSDQEMSDLMDGTVGHFIQKIQTIGGVDDLCTQILKTSPTEGLSEEDVPRQRALYGGNTPSPSHVQTQTPIPSLSSLVWAGAWSRDLLLIRIQFFLELIPFIFNIVLTPFESHDDIEDEGIISSILTFILIIFPLTIASYLIGWTNHKILTAYSGGQGRGRDAIGLTFSVIRNGVKRDGVARSELVVGDLCPLEYGTIVPADGVLINTAPDVTRDLRVYSGEFVRVGGSKMIVVAVGDNTVEARMAVKNKEVNSQEGASITNRTSILSDKLYSLTWFAIKFAIYFGMVIPIVLVIRFSVEKYAIEKQVWHPYHARRFVQFISHGVVMFSLALPDLIPLALVISLAVTCRRLLITNVKEGVFLRSIHNLTTFASATTLLIDGDCIDNTASDPEYIAEGIGACRRAGMSIRVLVEKNNTEYEESFGFSKAEICVVEWHSEKVGMIRSLAESGEIVALLSKGGPLDLEALQAAHVGIVMGHGAPSLGDIHLRTKNDLRGLKTLLGRGRRVYDDISVVFQIYIPAIAVWCALGTLLSVTVSSYGLTSAQMASIAIIMLLLILGVIYNSEREDVAMTGRATLGKSRLHFTTNLRRKNIGGQIIYQLIVLILLSLFILDFELITTGSDLLLENGLAWMTLFNVFNAKKGRGERNVFEALSFTNLFVWVWLFCAILQTLGSELVDATTSVHPMSISQWFMTFMAGLGTLVIYQLCCLIPIGRGRDGGPVNLPPDPSTTRTTPYTTDSV